jgi:hypothetical protein
MRSNGLQRWGHKEIVLAPVLSDDDLPRGVGQVISFLYSIHQHAKAGTLADVGGHSQLDPSGPGLFGRSDFKGVLYTRPYNLLSPELDAETLLAVVVTTEEFAVARQCGHTRVLARLGRHYRFFPTAPWCDPDRPQVMSQEDVTSSMVETMRMAAYDCAAWMNGGTEPEEMAPSDSLADKDVGDRIIKWSNGDVSLVLPRSIRPRLADLLRDLPDEAVFTLLTGIPPGIERCFVWPPNGNHANVICIDGTHDRRVAGNFISFVRNQPQSSAHVFEDGLAILMTRKDWDQLRTALMDGERTTIKADNGDAVLGMSWL